MSEPIRFCHAVIFLCCYLHVNKATLQILERLFRKRLRFFSQYNDRGSPPANSEWMTNRLKNDICHLTPGISELLLDIIDLLQENFDNYVRSMNKRVMELESNLRKYGSTISLNLADIDSENFTLTDPGSQEMKIHKKAYRDAHLKCSEMVSGVNLFLVAAQKFGEIDVSFICSLLLT